MTEESRELTFVFQLRGKPIEVMAGGETVLESEIVFASPTSKDLKEVSQLKQAVSRAMMEMAEKSVLKGDVDSDADTEKTAENITGENIMQAVAVSREPLDVLLEIGRKLLVSGVGKVAEQKFSSTLMQQVPCDELERMVGEYIRNFILKSFLGE
jgi:hypothetical protein